MTNPYTPPELPSDVPGRIPVLHGERVPAFGWAMKIGGLAGGVSAISITVFFNFSHVVYGNDMASMPILIHQLRGSSFYIAGVVLAVGFGRKSDRLANILPQLLMLAGGGYACLWAAELLVLMLHGVLLTQSESILANIGLRSTFLMAFMCWCLRVEVRKLRLAATVILGTLLWIVLWGLVGAVDLPSWTYWDRSAFNTAWSLLAAGQLWWMLRPAIRNEEVQRTRQDFLPENIDSEVDNSVQR